MYGNGQGLPQDYAEAAKWFRKAAEQGDARAQFNLGGMYGQGQGVPQDYVEAHMWLNLAASNAPGEKYEEYAAVRDRVASRMSAAQVAEAQRLARQWLAEREGARPR